MLYRYAVLITSYNRVDTTFKCLQSIQSQQLPDFVSLSVYLVDDASPDQTGNFVSTHFPNVHVLKGNGSLFWAGGMRFAMDAALTYEYDGFFLINDDVTLFPDAFRRLIEVNQYAISNFGKRGVYVGSTQNNDDGIISYGGRKITSQWSGSSVLITPSETIPVPCDLSHANILLVMREVIHQIPFFTPPFIHRLADYDFTLRVRKAMLPLLIAPGYYGLCDDDHGKNWLSTAFSLRQRISFLKNPKYLAYHEYLYFLKNHFPYSLPVAFLKLWLKTLFPFFWDKFKSVKLS
ncbi:MAG: glycosyltransferase family 2 protein [Bacteroidetes bacterium]|nr:glycosyltransferase family 2 protein [Bacteroidota bacterium]